MSSPPSARMDHTPAAGEAPKSGAISADPVPVSNPETAALAPAPAAAEEEEEEEEGTATMPTPAKIKDSVAPISSPAARVPSVSRPSLLGLVRLARTEMSSSGLLDAPEGLRGSSSGGGGVSNSVARNDAAASTPRSPKPYSAS
jgi:hypothetical protein